MAGVIAFQVVGLEMLTKLMNLGPNIQAITKVTLHQEGKKIRNYILRKMQSTSLSATGHSMAGGFPSIQSGTLSGSIRYNVSGWDELEFGSDIDYASYLELGTYKMSPRPFIQPTGEMFATTLANALSTNLRKVHML